MSAEHRRNPEAPIFHDAFMGVSRPFMQIITTATVTMIEGRYCVASTGGMAKDYFDTAQEAADFCEGYVVEWKVTPINALRK